LVSFETISVHYVYVLDQTASLPAMFLSANSIYHYGLCNSNRDVSISTYRHR